MRQEIVEVGFNVLSSVLMIILVISAGVPKMEHKRLMRMSGLFALIYATVVTVFNYMTLYEGLSGAAIYLVLVILFSIVLVRCAWWKRIFIAGYWQLVLLSASIGTLALIRLLNGDEVLEMMNSNYEWRIYVLILAFGLKMLGCWLFVFLQRKRMLDVKRYDGIVLSMFFLIIAVILLVLFTHALGYLEQSSLNLTAVLWILFLAVGVAVLLRISILSELARRQEKILSLLHEKEAQSADIEELKNKVGILQHDIKKHVNMVKLLVEGGNDEQALAYLEELGAEGRDLATQVECSGINLIDVALNRSKRRMDESKVSFYSQIQGEISAIVDEMDMCILLANLLDNAEEAARKCEKEQSVSLEMEGNARALRICVKNTVESAVLSTNPQLQTTKADVENHGWGMKSIHDIVNKYDGTLRHRDEDGWFVSEVTFAILDRNGPFLDRKIWNSDAKCAR